VVDATWPQNEKGVGAAEGAARRGLLGPREGYSLRTRGGGKKRGGSQDKGGGQHMIKVLGVVPKFPVKKETKVSHQEGESSSTGKRSGRAKRARWRGSATPANGRHRGFLADTTKGSWTEDSIGSGVLLVRDVRGKGGDKSRGGLKKRRRVVAARWVFQSAE